MMTSCMCIEIEISCVCTYRKFLIICDHPLKIKIYILLTTRMDVCSAGKQSTNLMDTHTDTDVYILAFPNICVFFFSLMAK